MSSEDKFAKQLRTLVHTLQKTPWLSEREDRCLRGPAKVRAGLCPRLALSFRFENCTWVGTDRAGGRGGGEGWCTRPASLSCPKDAENRVGSKQDGWHGQAFLGIMYCTLPITLTVEEPRGQLLQACHQGWA